MQTLRFVAMATLSMASCVPLRDDQVESPDQGSDLIVTASTQTPEVFEGMSVTFAAVAGGGTPPYLFRWDQNGGPAELALTDVTNATFTTGPLLEIGAYTFRAVVTDNDNAHATGYVTVEVQSVVTATAPKLAVVGQPEMLSATLETPSGTGTLFWEVTFGQASLSSPTSPNPTLTSGAAGTVRIRLTATIPSPQGAAVTAERNFEIASVEDLTPRVLIETNFGNITIELDGAAAPLHVANFLLYVDDGFFAGLLFHRIACSTNAESGECEPFVLQGGGYKRVEGEVEAVDVTRDPVPSEADNGLSNSVLYTVALALSGGDPDSGTTQFFINLSTDNSFLDDQGFTVFGQVVEGTDVIDEIAALEVIASPIIPGEVSLPAQDVIMERVTRVSIIE